MTVRTVTPAKPVVDIIQWDGSNFTDVEAFVTYQVRSNEDGTVTAYPGTSGERVAQTGDWLAKHVVGTAYGSSIGPIIAGNTISQFEDTPPA